MRRHLSFMGFSKICLLSLIASQVISIYLFTVALVESYDVFVDNMFNDKMHVAMCTICIFMGCHLAIRNMVAFWKRYKQMSEK